MTLRQHTGIAYAGLRNGVKLLPPSGTQSTDRVELSSGFLPAAAGPLPGTYADGSFVPRAPWRSPTCYERGILYGTPDPGAPPGDWIAVVPVPAPVLDACAELRAAAAVGAESALASLLDGPAGRMALVESIRWATTLTDPARPGIENPLLYGKTPAGNLTMTTGSHGLRVGMHVDSWYGNPLKSRAAAANRVSLNLGSRDRWLLCVNAPVQVMEQALREGDLLAGAGDPRFALGKRFMEVFPDYPVTKITVHPGEAYIAPTENMLHDAYAEPHGQIDLQFSCRGYFASP
ncbi:hypothetical protein [Nocardia sp. NBC_01327]|uniref:hypothetical protein n=1 Tax=Nocardia sp. NBC_01327 TaxID=2903593 RepID=UPI002E0F1F4C|nr:hypothetical protein OG326_30125 [Nocardia sp. NBC_01327]